MKPDIVDVAAPDSFTLSSRWWEAGIDLDGPKTAQNVIDAAGALGETPSSYYAKFPDRLPFVPKKIRDALGI